MRKKRIVGWNFVCGLGLLAFSSPALAVNVPWVTIGNPGNPDDVEGSTAEGSVAYVYRISRTEVTNEQYAEFLNLKAVTDPNGLWNSNMATLGGITRVGSPGTYSYSVIPGRADMPVNYVSFLDAARFANWLNNGQGGADTETGSYTMSAGVLTVRNPGAGVALPNAAEWYKAAYYDPDTGTYFEYPTGSETAPTCAAPTAVPNRANCENAVGDTTIAGSTMTGYSGSPSPYGTYDQAGNVWELSELAIGTGSNRAIWGSHFAGAASQSASAAGGNGSTSATGEFRTVGFRVVDVTPPVVPSAGAPAIAGLFASLALGAAWMLRRLRSPPPT